jgi:hypothetical protein
LCCCDASYVLAKRTFTGENFHLLATGSTT